MQHSDTAPSAAEDLRIEEDLVAAIQIRYSEFRAASDENRAEARKGFTRALLELNSLVLSGKFS